MRLSEVSVVLNRIQLVRSHRTNHVAFMLIFLPCESGGLLIIDATAHPLTFGKGRSIYQPIFDSIVRTYMH